MGCLRVLLALSVVLTHTGGLFRYTAAGGVAAVELFFMISGFFMAMVLSEKYDPLQQKAQFYKSRALRIFVPYYVVLLVSLAIYGFVWQHSGTGPLALLHHNEGLTAIPLAAMAVSQLTIIGQEVILFLKLDATGLSVSHVQPDLHLTYMMPLPPVWSVSLELIFYAMAPFIIRLKTRSIVWLTATLLLIRLVGWIHGLREDPWSYRFFPFELPLFLMGMLGFRFSGQWQWSHRTSVYLGLGFLGLVFCTRAIVFVLFRSGLNTEMFLWFLYGTGVVAIPTLFKLTQNIPLDSRIADFSYPLYLVHWPVITLVDSLAPTLSADTRSLTVVGLAVVLSWCVTYGVEKPVDRFRHKYLGAGRRSNAGEPSARRSTDRQLTIAGSDTH